MLLIDEYETRPVFFFFQKIPSSFYFPIVSSKFFFQLPKEKNKMEKELYNNLFHVSFLITKLLNTGRELYLYVN